MNGARFKLALIVGIALAWLCSCGDAATPRDYGDPTSLSKPTVEDGIVAWLVSPSTSEKLESATPEVVIAAYLEDDPTMPLSVQLGRIVRDATGTDEAIDLRAAERVGEPGKEQRFRIEAPLTHGNNRLLVRIESADHGHVRRLSYPLEYQGKNPGLTLRVKTPSESALLDGDVCSDTVAIRQSVTNARRACVQGSVTTVGRASAEVRVGVSGFARNKATLDEQGGFQVPIDLPRNRVDVVEVEVSDAEGRVTKARVRIIQDEKPPTLEVTSQETDTAAASIEVAGRVSDEYGVDTLEVVNTEGGTQEVAVAPVWSADVRLGFGQNPVEIVARDIAGNETRESLSLARIRTLWLDAPTRDTGATNIEVDRFDLDELLTPANQQELILVSIDLAPAVEQALNRIREPAKYGVNTSLWGDAEKNLQRILNMTPDTADLSGTSVDELLTISSAVGLPAPRILAELLDIGVTDYIVDPKTAADVLMQDLVGTHPNVKRDSTGAYVIEVTMYDIFQDMETIARRFGKVGDHPGFLSGTSHSEVLEPGFLLTLPVQSKLVQYDAIDLSRASKDFLFLLEGDRVLDFNVLSDAFVIVGLKDEPSIDLRFAVNEHPGPGMLTAGTSRTARPDAARPGFYRGDGKAWDIAPWLFEHITSEATYRMFGTSFAPDNYKRTLRYDAGSIDDAAVIDWDRGWVTITTAGGIGAPPAPLYAWDLLTEVAQVRLHDKGVPEGQANMAFALDDLPIGLTAQQLIDKLRPKLAEQEALLSELFVGDLGLAAPTADVFYVPGSEGSPGALLYRAPTDSNATYAYERPGFYADLAMTEKVSSSDAAFGSDDTVHEKVPAMLGAVYFAEDEAGDVYRIEIAQRDGGRVGVQVVKAQGVQ